MSKKTSTKTTDAVGVARTEFKFGISTLTTLVGAVLASASLSAVAYDIKDVQNFDASSKINTPAQPLLAARQAKLSKMATVSGMQNQYDQEMGKTTFSWARNSQSKPDLSAVAKEDQLKYAADFYLGQMTGVSSKKLGASQAVLVNLHDQGRGAAIAKYKQEVAGIEVFNREYNIMLDRELNFVASSGYFADNASISKFISSASNTFGESSNAVKTAFEAMGGKGASLKLDARPSDSKFTSFNVLKSESDYQVKGEPRAKRVYFEEKGQLSPAYYVEIEAGKQDSIDSDYYSFVVSAVTGEVFFKHNLTAQEAAFNYRVYADTDGIHKPWDGPHGNVVPADNADQVDATEYLDAPMVNLISGPISTKDAWLADDADRTEGNNVFAYVDAIAPDGFTNGDFYAETTGANTFDYKYDVTQTENSMHNRKAATVNLFYMTNFLHDWFYDHGFDEASGNAQEVNYGRGGEEGDSLRAEVQDNSGFNNANMSTPSDGASPRMQMYLWDSKDAINGEQYGITVTTHPALGLLQSTQRSSFGKGQFEISGDLVRIDDGTGTITDGCEAAVNGADLIGKIAIIDRGACAFTQKVLNAQDAGAIAVLVANNSGTTEPAPMGGSDENVKIPNMGISKDDGAAIYTLLDAAEKVSVSMFNEKPYKGSSWDNAIVSHEWGHYISNRLVGNSSGLINNQGRSMGEGWGDFHALLMVANQADAQLAGNESFEKAYAAISYVASFYWGIRSYPYSTDMTVNPLTFSGITDDPEVHGSGTVWATMLWDAYVGLINDERHTYSEAESLMMDYLVEGYKMTPIAPTFTEARDAILAAAYANDVEDYKTILGAFARRGLGLGAISPSRYSTTHVGVVESTKTELASFAVSDYDLNANYEGLTSGYCSNDNILDKGETGTVSFTVSNRGSEALTNVTAKIEVVSGDITLANDGMITFDSIDVFGSATSEPVEFTLNDAATEEQIVLNLTFPDLPVETEADEFAIATTVNYDFTDRAPENNASTDNMETNASLHDFSENVMIGGDLAEGSRIMDGTYTFLFPETDTQYMYIANNGFSSDISYETKTVTVGYGGDFKVTWWQYYELEEGYDGGVVEISVNGGDWADVRDMGGTFEGDGYLGTLTAQPGFPLSDRDAFTGYANWPGGFEAVNFGTALNGNEVQFRFRIASDSNTNWFGWIIDNVTFENITTSVYSDIVAGDTFACENRLPYVSVSDDQTVNEGSSVDLSVTATDPNGDALTYTWTQTAGTAATMTGADTATVSVTAPELASGSEDLEFTVMVNDGTDTVTETVKVTVNDVPEPVVPPTKKKGSGSMGFFALLLLPLAILRRRRK